MKIMFIIQTLLLLAWATPAPAGQANNKVCTNLDAKQYVFVDTKEGLAVLTTSKNGIIFGKIKRYPSGQIKISFQ